MTKGPFYYHGVTLVLAWISKSICFKVWNEITYPLWEFNGAGIEVWEWISNFFTYSYAFAFRCFYVYGLSVHPSICLSVRLPVYPSQQQTDSPLLRLLTGQLTLRPSICPKRFPGVFLTTHGRNGVTFGMQMSPHYLQNWLDFGHGLWIYLSLAPFWLVKGGAETYFLCFASSFI